jgi:hypothetical protein
MHATLWRSQYFRRKTFENVEKNNCSRYMGR